MLLTEITVSCSATQYGSASLFFDVCVCVDRLYIKLPQRHLHCCVISFLLENPGQKICVEDFFFIIELFELLKSLQPTFTTLIPCVCVFVCFSGLIVVWYSCWWTAVICKIDSPRELLQETGKNNTEVGLMKGFSSLPFLLFRNCTLSTDVWQGRQNANNYLIIVTQM